jgi:hypothetical protein
MIKTASIGSLGLSLSPIVHGEVMDINYEKNRIPGAANKQRTMPIMLLSKEDQITLEKVPVVSGNAVRGLGRRLLVDHSLDALEVNFNELFTTKEEAKRVLYFFRNGGLTPSGTAIEKVQIGTYEAIQSKIPFLLALGGVYQGHHFEGCVKVGIQIPIAKETLPLYKNMISKKHLEILEEKPLPAIDKLTTLHEMRYTKRAGDEKIEDKEAMIYGTEVIPAGIYFYSWSSVVTHYDSAILAFRAMNWLLQEYGVLGGMTGRGHGKMQFSLLYVDDDGERELNPKDYTDYIDYLKANRKEIIEAIKSIPEKLKYTTKTKQEKAS